MTTLPTVILIYTAVIAAVTAAEIKSNIVNKSVPPNNGIVGVASVAGVTSRNGRISSVSGVKFFPPPGSAPAGDMAFFFPLTKSDGKMSYRSISKQDDGKYASGTIQIGPGSVSVSSSARSEAPGNSWTSRYNKPLLNDMFFPSPVMIDPINFDPWFLNDMLSPNPVHPRFDNFRSRRPSPTFSPFMNYW